ncbi:hypothetical protein QYF36_019871 [Acer negundo]|nr:hypothetical protein QYF36_019871 [Acer negundo]
MGKPSSPERNSNSNGGVVKKGPWTVEEDQKLIDYIQKHGHGRWRLLPKNAGLKRCGKSCRLRWTNYLSPDIKRGEFSLEEEEIIIQLHRVLGNKWSAIAARLPGRTDNEIKNYWNTHIKKKLLRMGIDPVTHSPRLDLLQLYSSVLMTNSHHHHHININPSNHLLGSLLNPNNFLNIATATTPLNPPHNFQENQLLESFQQNLLHGQYPLDQACMNNNVPSDETQLTQANMEQFCSNPTSFNGSDVLQNYGYDHRDDQNQSFLNYYNNIINGDHHHHHQNVPNNMSFGSLLQSAEPSRSSTPLNSSSINFVNGGGTEDERDSYCSNNVLFDHRSDGIGLV